MNKFKDNMAKIGQKIQKYSRNLFIYSTPLLLNAPAITSTFQNAEWIFKNRMVNEQQIDDGGKKNSIKNQACDSEAGEPMFVFQNLGRLKGFGDSGQTTEGGLNKATIVTLDPELKDLKLLGSLLCAGYVAKALIDPYTTYKTEFGKTVQTNLGGPVENLKLAIAANSTKDAQFKNAMQNGLQTKAYEMAKNEILKMTKAELKAALAVTQNLNIAAGGAALNDTDLFQALLKDKATGYISILQDQIFVDMGKELAGKIPADLEKLKLFDYNKNIKEALQTVLRRNGIAINLDDMVMVRGMSMPKYGTLLADIAAESANLSATATKLMSEQVGWWESLKEYYKDLKWSGKAFKAGTVGFAVIFGTTMGIGWIIDVVHDIKTKTATAKDQADLDDNKSPKADGTGTQKTQEQPKSTAPAYILAANMEYTASNIATSAKFALDFSTYRSIAVPNYQISQTGELDVKATRGQIDLALKPYAKGVEFPDGSKAPLVSVRYTQGKMHIAVGHFWDKIVDDGNFVREGDDIKLTLKVDVAASKYTWTAYNKTTNREIHGTEDFNPWDNLKNKPTEYQFHAGAIK